MKNTNYEVEVVIDGKPRKQHWHDGKVWVEAIKGAHYEIKLKNNTSERVLAIVSVDGLDVISGSVANDESGGYIVPAYSPIYLKGFRVSDDEVNKFQFAAKYESYALNSQDGEKSVQNCGVIGVRFVKEKVKVNTYIARKRRVDDYVPWPQPQPYYPPRSPYKPPYPPAPWWKIPVTCSTLGAHAENDGNHTRCLTNNVRAASFSSDQTQLASTASFDLGTKFSDIKVEDRVTTVSFKRGETALETEIFYASRAALERFGVKFKPEPELVLPKAFKSGPYCKPPKK